MSSAVASSPCMRTKVARAAKSDACAREAGSRPSSSALFQASAIARYARAATRVAPLVDSDEVLRYGGRWPPVHVQAQPGTPVDLIDAHRVAQLDDRPEAEAARGGRIDHGGGQMLHRQRARHVDDLHHDTVLVTARHDRPCAAAVIQHVGHRLVNRQDEVTQPLFAQPGAFAEGPDRVADPLKLAADGAAELGLNAHDHYACQMSTAYRGGPGVLTSFPAESRQT